MARATATGPKVYGLGDRSGWQRAGQRADRQQRAEEGGRVKSESGPKRDATLTWTCSRRLGLALRWWGFPFLRARRHHPASPRVANQRPDSSQQRGAAAAATQTTPVTSRPLAQPCAWLSEVTPPSPTRRHLVRRDRVSSPKSRRAPSLSCNRLQRASCSAGCVACT